LLASFDPSYVKFEIVPPRIIVEKNAERKENTPFERPGTTPRVFRAAVIPTLVASGELAALAFVLSHDQFDPNEVITLEIPGLFPYPAQSGYVLLAKSRRSPAVLAVALGLTLEYFRDRTRSLVPRQDTPGGVEWGAILMDGQSEMLKAFLGHLLVQKKDFEEMDWSDLEIPGSDTDDDPVTYSADDILNWGARDQLLDQFAEHKVAAMKTGGGCSGTQNPCDCGVCFKSIHAQSRNPRPGNVPDELVIAAAKRAIEGCERLNPPAFAQLKKQILHLVATEQPILADVFSKHNILRSFSIPGVWPLDPLCVLRQWKGFEAMPSGLPDKLLSIATTLAKDLRAKQDKMFVQESELTRLGAPMTAKQQKKEETGKSRDLWYAINSGRAGRLTNPSLHRWTTEKLNQVATERRDESSCDKERRRGKQNEGRRSRRSRRQGRGRRSRAPGQGVRGAFAAARSRKGVERSARIGLSAHTVARVGVVVATTRVGFESTQKFASKNEPRSGCGSDRCLVASRSAPIEGCAEVPE
jgi:hypothetical protein